MQCAGGGRRHVFPVLFLAGVLCLPVVVTVVRAEGGGDGASRTPQAAASIYGADGRKPVRDTTQFPWSAIGLLKVQVGTEVYVGTGVMVGRYTALTCGHVVSGDETRNASAIQFIPGINGSLEPFGRAEVTRVIPSPQWDAFQADGYDIAMVVFDTPVGDQTGYFQYSVQPDSFFASASLTTAGYPTDLGTIYPYTVSGRSLRHGWQRHHPRPGQRTGPERLAGVVRGERSVRSTGRPAGGQLHYLEQPTGR